MWQAIPGFAGAEATYTVKIHDKPLTKGYSRTNNITAVPDKRARIYPNWARALEFIALRWPTYLISSNSKPERKLWPPYPSSSYFVALHINFSAREQCEVKYELLHTLLP